MNDSSNGDANSVRLLMRCLSPQQREQYAQQRQFHVVGGQTGRRYRIRHGRSQNVDELDGEGQRAWELCFFPHGGLPAEDVMLAQKMALELYEAETLQTARRFAVNRQDLARLYADHYRMFHNP